MVQPPPQCFYDVPEPSFSRSHSRQGFTSSADNQGHHLARHKSSDHDHRRHSVGNPSTLDSAPINQGGYHQSSEKIFSGPPVCLDKHPLCPKDGSIMPTRRSSTTSSYERHKETPQYEDISEPFFRFSFPEDNKDNPELMDRHSKSAELGLKTTRATKHDIDDDDDQYTPMEHPAVTTEEEYILVPPSIHACKSKSSTIPVPIPQASRKISDRQRIAQHNLSSGQSASSCSGSLLKCEDLSSIDESNESDKEGPKNYENQPLSQVPLRFNRSSYENSGSATLKRHVRVHRQDSYENVTSEHATSLYVEMALGMHSKGYTSDKAEESVSWNLERGPKGKFSSPHSREDPNP